MPGVMSQAVFADGTMGNPKEIPPFVEMKRQLREVGRWMAQHAPIADDDPLMQMMGTLSLQALAVAITEEIDPNEAGRQIGEALRAGLDEGSGRKRP